MATYQAKVNPYESPFSTSTDDQKHWQARLSIVHSTSKAIQRPNLSQILKNNRTNTIQIFFKRFVENSLAESLFKKSLKTERPQPQSTKITPCWCQRSPKAVSRAQSLWQWTQHLGWLNKKGQFSVRNLGSPKSKSSKHLEMWGKWKFGNALWLTCDKWSKFQCFTHWSKSPQVGAKPYRIESFAESSCRKCFVGHHTEDVEDHG